MNVIKNIGFHSYSLAADSLGEKTLDVLSITASSNARHSALVEAINTIHGKEPDTKIIVFATSNGYVSAKEALKTSGKKFSHVSNELDSVATSNGYISAKEALKTSGKKFSHVSNELDSVERQNEIISWFRHEDATAEDRKRPRILLLTFEQCAGHNLQQSCHNVILFDPIYSGTDAVADASVEEQAIGRVYRQGQQNDVTITRIILKGPEGETCLDDWIVERNTNEDVLRAATSNFD
eukprot:CAMPEP_0178851840 /NCGR_PEP_ID=MMETSP0746-20121128/21345_1 /TAXON_ID=913974 /ORGANISM="Nitzschia punctata, Strain CCMP561" /LENGTH=237 /DNA_ID=CAMNT_0020517449 /DNA_START=12 /DNA_END=725 /DNA_ORIENTATION=+